ncbi:MAG: ABC transporter permease subunit [Clostridia bacterium]|nr:ABC transporter permease subunit [Clostridia bacterium]
MSAQKAVKSHGQPTRLSKGLKIVGKAALILLAIASVVFVAYHDWVTALAALLLIYVFVYTDLPRIIGESWIGRVILDPISRFFGELLRPIRWLFGLIGKGLKSVLRFLTWPLRKIGGRMSMQQKRSCEALIFLLPWLVGLCLFFAGPIITSIRLSFSEILKLKGFEMGWVWLDNYQHIFFYDINFVPMFVQTITDTLLNTPICLVFSLVIAVLINRPMRGRGFFRAAFFIPVLLGAGYVMKQMLGMGADGTTITTGIVVPELIANLLGHSLTDFLQGVLDRITVVLWKSGVQIVLFLAGLQGISNSLYEAARVDGATEWEMFWKITLPMISPVILMNLVYTIVAFFTDATNPIIDYIYEMSFTNQQFGYGAAMSWVYFAFALLMCGVSMGVVGRYVFVSGGKE